MDDIVIERNPVNVMKLSEDEQALMNEIEIAPPAPKRPKPPVRRAAVSRPPMPEPEPDFEAFINHQKQSAPQRPFQPPEEDEGDGAEEYYGEEEQGGAEGGASDPNEQPSAGYTSIEDEKADILNKLSRLSKKGFQVNKALNAYSSIHDLRTEFRRIMYGIEVDQSIKFSRRMLVACVSGVEFLNKRYNPFEIQLDGWSESIMENLDDYDGVFEELYAKYRTKMNVAPEIKLIMMLGGSAMMFHLTNSMFKAVNVNDVMKQNPELVKSMVEAVKNTQQKTQPSEPPVNTGGRREMKGPGLDISSLMGGIMMPPAPPVSTTSMRPPVIEEELGIADDLSDIISVSGKSDGDIREVHLSGQPKKRASKKKGITLA